jgi:hypothetical protein
MLNQESPGDCLAVTPHGKCSSCIYLGWANGSMAIELSGISRLFVPQSKSQVGLASLDSKQPLSSEDMMPWHDKLCIDKHRTFCPKISEIDSRR